MKRDASDLTEIFEKLSSTERDTLLDFAEFLLSRSTVKPNPKSSLEPMAPQHEDAPQGESVVAALKRLRRTYSMLNTDSLFNKASALMSAHIMGGQSSESVVEELEILFDKHYQLYIQQFLPTK